MRLTVFFDYTCGHSFALKELLAGVSPGVKPRPEWKTLSLKEIRRRDGDPSVFDDRALHSFSLLALALSHAAREGDFDQYHRSVFDAIHKDHLEMEREDLFRIAEKSGVDIGAFERKRGSWLRRVKAEHGMAVKTWDALGTPTVVIDEKTAVYLRFDRSEFRPRGASALYKKLIAAASDPALLEIKRSG